MIGICTELFNYLANEILYVYVYAKSQNKFAMQSIDSQKPIGYFHIEAGR